MTHRATPTPAPHAIRLIAADVGGTHARVALVEAAHDVAPVIVQQHKYACADFASLAQILRSFLETIGMPALEHAAIAIAGKRDGDTLINANLPWPVSLDQTRVEAGLPGLALVNDFEALAFAMPYVDRGGVDRGEAMLLGGKPVPAGSGSVLVLGPGTGLGAALWIPGSPADGIPPQVRASEPGHASLAVGNETEIGVLRWLLQRHPHVGNERVLSGPGLVNTFRALCEMRGVPATLDDPARITALAESGEDAVAVETLHVFCALLGSLAGDLALTLGAAEVCLAGGIPSRIADFLRNSDFMPRFLDKGRLRPVLERVPVWLVEHGSLGILGAASWYLHGRDSVE